MPYLSNIFVFLGVLSIFCLAVIIHEFGHFLAAKLLGFKIEAFSLFFGPAIWKRKIGDCTYRIGSIPLGGYVSLPQLDPAGMARIQGGDGKGEQHAPVKAWKRMVVAFAGPFGNILMAVCIAFAIGIFAPDGDFGGTRAVIGAVDETGPISRTPLKAGDTIVSIGGRDVAFWHDIVIESHFAGNADSGVEAVIQPMGGGVKDRYSAILPIEKNPQLNGYMHIPGISPKERCAIGSVATNSPAAEAGLKASDEILSVNGVSVNGPLHAVSLIQGAGTNAVRIAALPARGAKPFFVTAIPRYDEALGRHAIGVSLVNPSSGIPQWMMHKSPAKQLMGDAKGIFRILRALFMPKNKGESRKAARDMGGPGTLFFVLWYEVQAGIFHSLAFLRFLSVNLAVINLLPLPVLDGGHILFALAETASGRRPSPKFVDRITGFFAVLLMGLMALLLVRDALRIHRFASSGRPAAVSRGNGDGNE